MSDVKVENVISMKQLLEAGVHFGHQTKRWNPKMAKYIYTSRNEIHIIDLQKSADGVNGAYHFIRSVVEAGKSVLFVGTKKQAQEAIKEEATRCGMFYMNERWLGGTLTNNKTIKTRIDYLNKINRMEESGEFSLLPKKEVYKLISERDVLEKNLGGIKNMHSLPGAMFVVDINKEDIAVKEARLLGIPVVGIVDTNCDPDRVDYVIPGNDDAIRSIKLIASVIADAVLGQVKNEEQLDEVVAAANDAIEPQVTEAVVAEAVMADAVVAAVVADVADVVVEG